MSDTTILLDGLHFGEGPRWRGDRLVFSDFYAHKVRSVTLTGRTEDLLDVPHQPSGLGWLPDGRMLVVSMTDRRVLRVEEDGSVVTHADISHLAGWWANDMVVDAEGRAYVGNFGFDLDTFLETHGVEGVLGEPGPTATVLALVQPDGTVEVAAEDMVFPNGTVITADGSTMIIAETLALRLTAFDIDRATGRLSNRRVWADLSERMVAPDGIAIDDSGAVWVANALAPQAIRVVEGGEVTGEVTTSRNCYAVALGGTDGHTLFCVTANTSHHAEAAAATDGRIEIVTV